MPNLNEDLELLYELNDLRHRARKLRRGGLASLRGIADISISGKVTAAKKENQRYYDNWITSGNEVEAALLVRVQNHKDIGESDAENDEAEARPELKERLKNISLKSLFPSLTKTIGILDAPGGKPNDEYVDLRIYKKRLGDPRGMTVTDKFLELVDSTVPVLVAARAMHALVGRAETVFHRATMICYYRIVRELYFAVHPDWIIGAARANAGSDASSFVTGECIRAVLAFEHSIARAVTFFRNTRELYRRYRRIQTMLDGLGANRPGHPLYLWADKAIERMWLNWFVSTNPRHSEIAVKHVLTSIPRRADMKSVGRYLAGLPAALKRYAADAYAQIEEAKREIDRVREEQNPYDEEGNPKGYSEEEVRVYQQTESAHRMAYRAIDRGIEETSRAQEMFFASGDVEIILEEFARQFEDISQRIHRILEPAKRYVRTVVNRELALAVTEMGRFDAGELAFAAASLGATTEWRQSERLSRACELLIENLPTSGSLPTRRPFHSNTRGYRLVPIGCEMTRSFAQLLQRTGHAFEPKLVRRMLNIFEESRIQAPPAARGDGEEEERMAWNFEGAPHPDRPCVWVTAVAVFALDRIVRMLNERVNAVVLKNFEVIRPENPHTNLTLNNILYPDYGVSQLPPWRGHAVGVTLERMRAHVVRAMMPGDYKGGKSDKVFSVILYGPPGTGKTTLVEALALSSNAPLVRISPSDLTVQGQELIEGRARAVFEALSMLTQAVIILDEFETVLHDRLSTNGTPPAPILKFLMTGMLPKLLKLHDAAKRQSLVYCLATNHITEIDKAAKRTGRFDLHLPIYNPDPLSRAGAFLYRAVMNDMEVGGGAKKRKEQEKRLLDVVRDTASATAGGLAEAYFNHKSAESCFDYFLGGEKGYEARRWEELKPDGRHSPDEEREREELNEWEGRVAKIESGFEGDKLAYCLSPTPPGGAAAERPPSRRGAGKGARRRLS